MDQFPELFMDTTVDGATALMQKSAGLRLSLNSLLKEHVMLGLDVLRNAYDANPGFDGSLAQLDMNTLEIAAAI